MNYYDKGMMDGWNGDEPEIELMAHEIRELDWILNADNDEEE